MLTFFMNRPIDFAAQNTLSFGKIILWCTTPWKGTLEQLIWSKELIRSTEGYQQCVLQRSVLHQYSWSIVTPRIITNLIIEVKGCY